MQDSLRLPSEASLAFPATSLSVPAIAMAFPAVAMVFPATEPSATEQPVWGTESLRSSDEFPANKENSHRSFLSAATAGNHSRLAKADADEQHVVSEHVLAQEAVYALQVTNFDSYSYTYNYSYNCSGCANCTVEPLRHTLQMSGCKLA